MPDITNILNIPQGTIPCRGNGIAIGVKGNLTSGGLGYRGLGLPSTGSNVDTWSKTGYGLPITSTPTGNGPSWKNTSLIGLTDEADKSGIVADFSSGTVTCNYVIKY